MASRSGIELTDPIKLLLSLFIPPLGVAMEVGIGGQFWLNLLLTLCGYFPGVIHAAWVIFSR
jgi:uncharacterized membrane protein YqaE (UPF0057 family)